jgi:hypothetical protein
MTGFVNAFLDLNAFVHKDANLVRGLVDLIQQDQSIQDNEYFYIGPNGEKVKKAAFGGLTEVCFPSFFVLPFSFSIFFQDAASCKVRI